MVIVGVLVIAPRYHCGNDSDVLFPYDSDNVIITAERLGVGVVLKLMVYR